MRFRITVVYLARLMGNRFGSLVKLRRLLNVEICQKDTITTTFFPIKYQLTVSSAIVCAWNPVSLVEIFAHTSSQVMYIQYMVKLA